MSEATRKKVIYVLLGLAILWGAYNIMGDKSTKTPVPTTQAGMVQSTMEVAAVTQGPFMVENPERFAGTPWGKDPFRTKMKTTVFTSDNSSPIQFHLSGIIYSKNHPMAIVNSRPVGIGDTIEGATVVSITRQAVKLKQSGQTITLNVSRG